MLWPYIALALASVALCVVVYRLLILEARVSDLEDALAEEGGP